MKLKRTDEENRKLLKIGKSCRYFRESMLEMSAEEVASYMNVSIANLYCFENGKINNELILFYYIRLGWSEKYILGGGV